DWGHRRRNGARPLTGQRLCPRLPQRTADAERNELTGGLLDEARHDGVIPVARQEFPETAAVRVRREPVRPAGEQQRVPGRARVPVRGVRRNYLMMKAALRAAPRSET